MSSVYQYEYRGPFVRALILGYGTQILIAGEMNRRRDVSVQNILKSLLPIPAAMWALQQCASCHSRCSRALLISCQGRTSRHELWSVSAAFWALERGVAVPKGLARGVCGEVRAQIESGGAGKAIQAAVAVFLVRDTPFLATGIRTLLICLVSQ